MSEKWKILNNFGILLFLATLRTFKELAIFFPEAGFLDPIHQNSQVEQLSYFYKVTKQRLFYAMSYDEERLKPSISGVNCNMNTPGLPLLLIDET